MAVVIDLDEKERKFLADCAKEQQALQQRLAAIQEQVNGACRYFLFTRGETAGNWTLDDQLRLTRPDEQ